MPPTSSLSLLIFLICWHLAKPITMIMSDSAVPSALIDRPQTGFSIKNNDGAHTAAHEQEAVYDIMRATGNDWATDIPDVCRGRWHGIECMPDNDDVYHVVSLSFGALSDDTAFPTCDSRSYISPSITKLPHIRTLFFYRCLNDNPQPIPLFLGLLGPSLRTLVLRENGLVGPIPVELGNLTYLGVLDLHKNNLNGLIPSSLSGISGLKSLDLSGNRLTGPIPRFILPDLTVLDLSQNLLLGSIPPSLGSCQLLIKIDLGHNCLTSPIPNSINTLKGLILMDLSYNRLSQFPQSLSNLTSLEALIMKGNPMGSKTIIPSNFFEQMTGLTTLILSNMGLHGPIPESLGRLPNLRVVYLDGNRFNGSIPKTFNDLKHASEMSLNDNHLTGPVPFAREMVWRMRRKLRLYNNSGLCCNFNSGLEEQLGIGLCDLTKPNPGRTVHHLQAIATVNVSSGAGSVSVGLSVLFVSALWLL